MGRLFGTDGIRGPVGTVLTPELVLKVGKAAGEVLAPDKKGTVFVGRDTRESGDFLVAALSAGLLSQGLDVVDLGVIPTPGVAYITKHSQGVAGVVISASHNPYKDNGIKFFSHEGYKLPDETEELMEEYILGEREFSQHSGNYGKKIEDPESVRSYENHLRKLSRHPLRQKTVAMDCGNGAVSSIAPRLFAALGANIIPINTTPDGKNINDGVGSTHPEVIQELVKGRGADIGLSFDGDADRLIAVDERGRIVDGDHILAILAVYLKGMGKLKGDTVVGTVMSNIGLTRYLEEHGLTLIQAPVGDRYVLEQMRKGDFTLGGEQSGHIIVEEYNTTGDGLATALLLLEVMEATDLPLSRLNDVMTSYPQVLFNARVKEEHKKTWDRDPEIQQAVQGLNEFFHGEGRVLIRPSGTEPFVRVMVEGTDLVVMEEKAMELVALLERRLG